MKDKYKTLILACWIVLLSCFIIKILGGNFFEIMCNNKTFINICNFIENTFLYYVVVFINFYIGAIFYYKAILQKDNLKGKYLFIHLILLVIWIIKLLVNNNVILALLTDLLFTIIIPIILDRTKWKRAIFGSLLTLGFQVISLITKNIGLKIIDDNVLITLIFMIDYYIMMILYYLYSIKKLKKGE